MPAWENVKGYFNPIWIRVILYGNRGILADKSSASTIIRIIPPINRSVGLSSD
jgi:hypothetical protein